MSILEEVYASGGDILIHTLELECDAWPAPVRICNGFEDQTCIDEDSVSKVFYASGMSISLPKRDNSGNQNLRFGIDDIAGTAQDLVFRSLENNERITLTYRLYLASDKSAPAENPLWMTVLAGAFQGSILSVECGFFNMIGCAWPRTKYTTLFTPGVRYL